MINFYEIIKNNSRPYLNIEKSYKINIAKNPSIEEIREYLIKCVHINKLFYENVYIASIDSNGDLLGFHRISIGNKTSSNFDINSILTHLLLIGAYSFLIIHNHPNNMLKISENDIDSYNSIKTFSELINIICVDSIITTEIGWMSIKTGDIYYDKKIF